MSRHCDPLLPYRFTSHSSKGNLYASVKKLYSDESGKTRITDVYLGKLAVSDDPAFSFTFIPNKTFIYMDQKERDKYIFPDDWDISAVHRLKAENAKQVEELIRSIDRSYLYGDVWLMNKIAEDTGIISHLNKVFDGNQVYVQDTLTLAYHMFLTKHSWNSVARWQKISKTPTSETERILSAPYITEFTQSITEKNRSDLLRLRINMVKDEDLVCIDSTTHSGYGGKRLCEIDFGYNKDDRQLPCTVETMAYSLNTHMPIYYQSFQGNMVDVRTTEMVLNELRALGFSNKIVTCTDRGYYYDDEIQWHIKNDIALISFAKVDSSLVRKHIPDISYSGSPYGMEMDYQERLYYGKYEEEYSFTDHDGTVYRGILNINLYYNPEFRPSKQFDLDDKVKKEALQLAEISAHSQTMSDEEVKKIKYHTVKRDKTTKAVESFSANENKIRRKMKTMGFYAIVTYGLKDYEPIPILKIYRMRGEQEQCFEIEKEVNGQDKQRSWSQDGRQGRRFITFIGNSLVSYARSQWRNDPELYDAFDSTSEMFDAMRPVKWISHPGADVHMTPLVGEQLLIAEKFNLDVNDACLPGSKRKNKIKKSSKTSKKKTVRKHSKF